MSTPDFTHDNTSTEYFAWMTFIDETEYHAAARRGEYVSSTMLKEFRRSPAAYRAVTLGVGYRGDTTPMRVGRAVHKLLLEGEHAFRIAYRVGGPLNHRTGLSYGAESAAFKTWLLEQGWQAAHTLTPREAELVFTLRNAVRHHPEAGHLLQQGVAEHAARMEYENLPCQIRLDWLTPEGVAVDIKTIECLDRFETDARRLGYLHQAAFYRACAQAAGGGDLTMAVVAVEKKVPHRVGVWYYPASVLKPYEEENKTALRRLRRCREEQRWPTGYEQPRNFPTAGIPPAWLN